MNMQPLLLCLSNNPELLEIRTRVLATRYRVVPVLGLDALKALPGDSAFSVLVLCHTLQDGDCEAAINTVRAVWPAIRIVMVTTGYADCLEFGADAVVDSLAGGTALLRAIERVTVSYPGAYTELGTVWQ